MSLRVFSMKFVFIGGGIGGYFFIVKVLVIELEK